MQEECADRSWPHAPRGHRPHRDPISEDRLTEMADSCGMSLHEVMLLEVKWGCLPHRILAYGKAEALHTFR